MKKDMYRDKFVGGGGGGGGGWRISKEYRNKVPIDFQTLHSYKTIKSVAK